MEEIIANHIIKPSSPTPVEYKNHTLSRLDQVAPPVYVSLIFFYENDESKQHKQMSQLLRQSLSEILTIFYPLGGTIRRNSSVDCNDRGAVFVEARVHARLAQFVQHPEMEELKQLIPVQSSSDNGNGNGTTLLVKANYFDCGGIAVGVCILHKIGDASSFVRFMNAWAATCRGESSGIIRPSFDLSLRLPPKYLLSFASRFSPGITKEKIVTKRIVFEREKLEKLRKQAAASSEEVKDPSRVEAVTAFIWRSFIEANKAGGTSSFAASHMVDLRPRVVPPIPDHAFGNCITTASAVVSRDDDGGGGVRVSKLRAAIRAVVADFEFISGGNSTTAFLAKVFRLRSIFNAGNCIFTSWWRFPMYDVDFGWGKPVWVCTVPMPYMNLVVLMATPSGDGIEAWVNAPHEDFFQLLQANYDNLLN